MTIEVTATPRSAQGTGASRRLRRTAKVPGVVYGAGQPAQLIELDHNALYLQMRNEAFHASILTMNLDGTKQRVLLRDLQMHPWKPQVLHVDFQRVAANQKIHMKVPLHFKNEDVAPGVKAGGIISHVMSELHVSCLPDDLPEFIEVDLAELQLGHSVHLADLVLPTGVESVQLTRGDNAVVATVVIPKVIEEEVAPAEAAVAVEGEAVPAEGAAAPGAAPAAAAPAAEEKKEDKREDKKKEGDKR